MNNEKTIELTTAAGLREALAIYEQQSRPVHNLALSAPGITADMSPKAQDAANTLYGESILAKNSSFWTVEEKAFVRGNVRSVLKDLGY